MNVCVRKVIMITLGVLYSCMTRGQGTVVLPATPESQGLLKMVNVQMNKATGTVGFSVPLCEAGDGGLKFPVCLSYTCVALKVRDIASWVGTGWNLSAGGKITRVIVDNDDLQGGYCRGQGVLANNLSSWWSGGSVNAERKDEHVGDPCTGCNTFDGEPDLFYYEIPNASGMFVIDRDGKAWTIPYSNVKIELKTDDTFLLTDESGVRYYFDLKETTRETSHSDRKHANVSSSPYGEKSVVVDYISTWHLTRVRDLFGEEVNFSYSSGGAYISYENKNYLRLNNKEPEDRSVHFSTQPHYLEEISWSSGRLQFVSSGGRIDMSGSRLLNEIKVYTIGDKYRKSIKFSYSRTSGGRPFLNKVIEEAGEETVTLGKYEYFIDCYLPDRNSMDIDHWGYYNGKNNTTWFPADGASREPVPACTRANMLKKAYNSLGGCTEYEYEANTLANGKVAGGVRIKSVRTSDANGNEQVMTYTYSGGASFNTCTIYSNNMGGSNVLKYVFSTLNLHDTGGSNVYYGSVTENLPNGSKIVSTFTTYADCDDVRSRYYINPSESNENPVISLFPNSSRFWRRGLLKSEVYKDAAGREVKRVENTYRFPSEPKCRIKGFFLQSSVTYLNKEIDHVVVYDWLSEAIYLVADTITDVQALNSGRRIVYDTVYCVPVEEQVNYENGDVCRTTKSYAFSYARRSNPAGSKDSNAIGLLLSSGLALTPVEQVEYRNGQITGGELMFYEGVVGESGAFIPVLSKIKVLTSLPVAGTSFVPSVLNSSSRFIHDSRYETSRVCDRYDSRGRLLEWHDGNGVRRSVIYPVAGMEPMAVVNNAGSDRVFHSSFEENANAIVPGGRARTGNKVYPGVYALVLSGLLPGNYRLSYWKSSDDGQSWEYAEEALTVTATSTTRSIGVQGGLIDEVRVLPGDAVMVTYTCLPGVGTTSETDANGRTVYYEYDAFGRLVRVLDDKCETVKEYEYFIDFK